MDAATISVNSAGGSGEFPTIIQRARPYLTEEQIEDLKPDDPGWEARDVSMRLNACNWILSIGALLQFPIRTMATAMILFHRFKLFHPKWEHPYSDCAAAALFVACKIEDTLKKSREILAAGHSIKHGATSAESINPDNPLLDEPARRTLILERVILESSSFDFRNRHSQPFLIKFCRKLGLDKEVSRLGWDICIDCYRTLSPLKATPHVQALAAISLAQKLLGRKEIPIEYDKFEAKRADVLDVMKDLLDLYTHHRSYTIVGEKYSAETYITIRIALNEVSAQEASSSRINGSHHSNGKGKGKGVSALAPGITGLSEKDKLAIGESVRFMLDGERERKERRGSVMDTREG
ncbi:cyclin-like protein [Kalaharituber pfeilii]|nr:cyclin-like protein [Kalaharituber pfeilii]